MLNDPQDFCAQVMPAPLQGTTTTSPQHTVLTCLSHHAVHPHWTHIAVGRAQTQPPGVTRPHNTVTPHKCPLASPIAENRFPPHPTQGPQLPSPVHPALCALALCTPSLHAPCLHAPQPHMSHLPTPLLLATQHQHWHTSTPSTPCRAALHAGESHSATTSPSSLLTPPGPPIPPWQHPTTPCHFSHREGEGVRGGPR